MENQSHRFDILSAEALRNHHLNSSLERLRGGLSWTRAAALEQFPQFDQAKVRAVEVKDHCLRHLDHYLEQLESAVTAQGGQVHWAIDAAAASQTVVDLCRKHSAHKVIKSKSMVTEEIALNRHLEDAGFEVTETDLGEYIIQLRQEPPSHIVGPAIHLTVDQVAQTFAEHHTDHPSARRPERAAVSDLVTEAREVLRSRFLEADVGITGANFLVADSGTAVVVTNEGNADLCAVLPRVQIVVAGIDKVVPNARETANLLRLLTRSATGQPCATYTSFFSPGGHAQSPPDRPFHLVLVDNGRSRLVGSEQQDILRCIRCGACMNHCPVYAEIGGQAYGSVYPGPMGAVWTPALVGLERSAVLPAASTFCGRCESVCPVAIPLPRLMRNWRAEAHERGLDPPATRLGLRLWRWFAERPGAYRGVTRAAARGLAWLGRRHGYLRSLPIGRGWLAWRDLPSPEGQTFMDLMRGDERLQ